jgi:NAD+ synthase (glutamine-hydrolysing)
MKIAAAQLNVVIGDFDRNVAAIIDRIEAARRGGARLVIFPELAVCGYPPLDFLEFGDFIARCQKAVHQIARHCKGIAAIVGAPSRNAVPEGKDLFNSAYLLDEGMIRAVVHKSLLPNYDVFDEYRYFEPGRNTSCVEVDGLRIALTICEDLWNEGEDPLYTRYPMDEIVRDKPDLMVNIAASPFDYQHAEVRLHVLRKNVQKYQLPLLYVNHVGAQTELIFDGGSLALQSDGEIAGGLPYFREDLAIFEMDAGRWSSAAGPAVAGSAIERIHDALVLGIRDYFGKLGFQKAILGLSGGIDSAVVAVLAARALGPENIKALLMPGEFSSQHSLDDAMDFQQRTGITGETISIQDIYADYLQALAPAFGDRPFSVAEENLQARIRGMLLMAQCNKFGYVLLNTSNKSEAAVGYGTLYGDMCGGLSVIGDVYKTDVYALARHINRSGEIIPQAILDKAPSAELRPGQKDSDSLPEYSVLDPILYQYIEQRQGPKEIIAMGYDETLVLRILRMVNSNEHKRYQTPPMLRVSPKAFGLGRRMPIVGRYLC